MYIFVYCGTRHLHNARRPATFARGKRGKANPRTNVNAIIYLLAIDVVVHYPITYQMGADGI